MRKLVFVLMIFTVLAFGFSCEKCAECTTTTIISDNWSGNVQNNSTRFNACGDELKEADGFRETSTQQMGDGKISQTSISTTCQ